MRAKKRAQIERARECPAAFVEYVFADEKTGRRITNAPHHKEWHRAWTEGRWTVLISPIEHGKSFHATGRLLWEMGTNPNIRCAIIGESKPSAQKLLKSIRQQIENNPKVQEVFPNLVPSERTGDPWTDKDLTIKRTSLARDPTVQARGAGSKDILGSRLDLIVMDDVLNQDNTRTKEARDKLEDWFDTTLFTRLNDDYRTGQMGKVYVIGTPWDTDDLLHRLRAREGWTSVHMGAVHNPDDPVEKWRPLWPEQWPVQRLVDKKEGTTHHAFNRKYLCRVRVDANARFKQAWIDHMFAQGAKRTLLDKQPRGKRGLLRCFTGVDLGIGQTSGHDLTVLFTIAVDDRGRRIVVDVESGRWDGPTIVQKIGQKHWRYQSDIVVESNSAQRFIQQFATQDGLPVRPFTTGAHNKWDESFGVESLAVELRSGLWIAPACSFELDHNGDRIVDATGRFKILSKRHPELVQWAHDMLYFDPDSHTGDHLMAAWFAREAARSWSKPRQQRSQHAVR